MIQLQHSSTRCQYTDFKKNHTPYTTIPGTIQSHTTILRYRIPGIPTKHEHGTAKRDPNIHQVNYCTIQGVKHTRERAPTTRYTAVYAIQYRYVHALQYNTSPNVSHHKLQCNTIPYTIPHHTLQQRHTTSHTPHPNTIPKHNHAGKRGPTTKNNTKPYDTTQYNTIQYQTTQYRTTSYYRKK